MMLVNKLDTKNKHVHMYILDVIVFNCALTWVGNEVNEGSQI